MILRYCRELDVWETGAGECGSVCRDVGKYYAETGFWISGSFVDREMW